MTTSVLNQVIFTVNLCVMLRRLATIAPTRSVEAFRSASIVATVPRPAPISVDRVVSKIQVVSVIPSIINLPIPSAPLDDSDEADVSLSSVLKKRRKKMTKHKLRKRRKRDKHKRK